MTSSDLLNLNYLANCQNPNTTQHNGWVWHENDCANHPTPQTNFSATSRPDRELKFGTDIH